MTTRAGRSTCLEPGADPEVLNSGYERIEFVVNSPSPSTRRWMDGHLPVNPPALWAIGRFMAASVSDKTAAAD
jgi:hypothetical protein